MTLINKPGTAKGQRPAVGSAAVPDELTEMEPTMPAAEVLGPQAAPTPPRPGRSWRRAGSIGLLVFGVVAGMFMVMHGVSLNKKQAALNAAQANQSLRVKAQTIGLNNLGLTPISLLNQQSGTLTVNGQINVADSVVLDPTGQPRSAVPGQLYYDQARNQLGYYNGGNFIYLQGSTTAGNSLTNVSNVYNVNNVSNVTNISNFTNAVTGPLGVIPMFNGSGLSDSIMNQEGNGVAVGATANTATRFTIAGATADNSTNALTVTNGAGDTFAQVADDGTVNLGRSPGAAIGNTQVFPTSDTGTSNIISADKFLTSSATTVVSMSVYVGAVNSFPFNQYQLAIYTDNSGVPGILVATSGVGLLSAHIWNTLPISATLAGGTEYWLAYTANNNAPTLDNPYYTSTSSPTHAWVNFTFGSGSQNGMPATFPPPNAVNDYTHTIYATTLGTGSALTLNSSGSLSSTGAASFQDLNNSSTAFQVQNSTGFDVLDVDTSDNNVGIGTSAPTTARLSVFGASSDNTTKAFSVSSSNGTSLAQITDDGSIGLGESRAIFGNNSSGNFTGSGYYNAGFQLMQAQSFTTTAGGAVNALSTYIGQSISSTNNLYQMAIYSDFSNAPNTYIASTHVGTLSSTGWNTLPISATLAANTKYWLVYWTNVTDGSHNGQNFISGYTGPNCFAQAYETWQGGASNGMPTTYPSLIGAPGCSYETSIYATYTAPVTALSLDASGDVTSNGSLMIQNGSNTALEVADATGGQALVVDATSKDVAINAASSIGFNLGVTGNVGIFGNNANALQIDNGGWQPLFTADTNAMNIIVAGTTTSFATLTLTNAHVASTQTTKPTISTPINCGSTPSAQVTAGSTDSAGSFTITTGSGTPTNCDSVLTFNQPYGAAPKSIILTPALSIGGATVSTDARVSAADQNSFTAQIDSPAASSAYSYYYWVVQ